MKKVNDEAIPIWGGIECTINRLQNRFYDQLEMTGFYENPDQINSILKTGVQTLRFPVLWEKHQPIKNEVIDWEWSEKQLNILRTNGICPVVGLLHHGSGPAYTNLLDDNFPSLFA